LSLALTTADNAGLGWGGSKRESSLANVEASLSERTIE
jgi:hypothetical protein